MFSTRLVYTNELTVKSILVYLLFVINLLTCLASEVHMDRSGLCINEGNASCSNQVAMFNLSDDACRMFYRKPNSAVCSKDYFSGDVDEGNKFSRLSFQTYLYKEHSYVSSAFNLTFSNIKWVSMKMRFSEDGVEGIRSCREFNISPNIPPNFFFYYDCLWNTMSSHHKSYIFQYQITTQSSDTYHYRYIFKVPEYRNMDEFKTSISDWEVFSVVDVIGKASKLCLLVQAVPVQFNVTTYIIQVIRDNMTLVEKIVHHDPHEPTFTFTYNTNSEPGKYNFRVRFEHPECGKNCSVSTTPYIEIFETRSPWEVFGIVILLTVGLISYVLWARRRKSNLPDFSPSPKFLLVYDPVSVQHLNLMVEVSKYFNRTYKLQAMIDVIEIPLSNHQDPSKWYTQAFHEADFVGVFASPLSVSNGKDVKKNTIYTDNYAIALTRLSERKYAKSKCKFFTVTLPNCSWDSLPLEAKSLKRYALPKETSKLLKVFGVVPLKNAGKHFMEALENTNNERAPLVLTLETNSCHIRSKEIDTDWNITPGSSIQSSPILTRDTCCLALTVSDPDLDHISNSQEILAYRSNLDSSDDEFSIS